ncbi:MAG: site-specific integrase [Bdellovibrionota bacterium]|nr:site-specific integrase [Bdellovibrionota bacterium]
MKKLDLLKEQQNFLQALEAKGKSANTLKNYRTDLNIFNQYLAKKGRELILNELTLAEIKEYDHYLEKKYNSPNSIRRRVQALRIFFDFLIEKALIDYNPIKKMVVSPKVVDLPNPTTFFKVKELKAYLSSQIEAANGHEQLLAARNMVLFYLIYGAGLKVSDIEKIKINHVTEAKGLYRVMIAHEKKDPFTVTLPEEFNPIFEHYLTLLEEGKERDKIFFHDLLFNANPFRILKGGLSARGIEIIFKEFSTKLEHSITARSLRQACIFKWIGAGVPLSRVKEWMGVQPQYSLKPFQVLMKDKPSDFAFLEV